MGRRLQEARQNAGMTQQMLCQHAGLSYSTLTKIERGAIKAPSIFTIQNIANALGVGLDELLGVSSSQPPNKVHSKSGIRFIYFDINGCLVRFFHRAFSKLAEESDVPVDVIETTFWHYNDIICRGEMSIEEFNTILAKNFNLSRVDWQTYYMEAVEPISVMQDVISWAGKLYYIGLLTNIMPGFVNELKRRHILPELRYDAIVDSSEVKAIKPEAKIYEVATERAKCSPNEILLVDDSRANLIAAEKKGWHVLWFDDSRPDESAARVREALEPVED